MEPNTTTNTQSIMSEAKALLRQKEHDARVIEIADLTDQISILNDKIESCTKRIAQIESGEVKYHQSDGVFRNAMGMAAV